MVMEGQLIHISKNLRKKLGKYACYIQTVIKTGYMLNEFMYSIKKPHIMNHPNSVYLFISTIPLPRKCFQFDFIFTNNTRN